VIGTIERFFSELTGAQRVVAFLAVVAIAAVLIGYLAGGWQTGVPIGIIVLGVLWLSSPVWKPPGDTGSTKVRLTSLAVVSTVSLAVLGKTPEAKPVLTRILEAIGFKHESALQAATSANGLIVASVLTFVLVLVFAINWFTRDKSVMQKHPIPLSQDFPDQTYQQQLRRYAQILTSRLNTLDEETKWDDYYFTPLEAEVEVVSGRQSKKRIVDLMQALKADRTSRIVLVLGGSP